MATLKYNGIEYNVIYVDPKEGIEGGTGETVNDALLDLPDPLVNNTCYVIRRFDDTKGYVVDLKRSWFNNDLKNLIFLGMPDKNNSFYQLLENTVKEHWDADEDKYAAIRCNMYDNLSDYGSNGRNFNNASNTTLFKTTSIESFIAENCYFYRDGAGDSSLQSNGGYTGSNTYYWYGVSCRVGFIFGFNRGDEIISFNNCKFSYSGYDLENNTYITSNRDVGLDTSNSKYPEYKCQAYIVARNPISFNMSNCIINGVSVYSSHSSREIVYSNLSDINYLTYYSPDGALIYIHDGRYINFVNNVHNQVYRKPSFITNTNRNINDMCEKVDGLIHLNARYVNVSNFELNRLVTQQGLLNYGCLKIYGDDIKVHKISVNNKFMYDLGDHTGEDEQSLRVTDIWNANWHYPMFYIWARKNLQCDTITCDNINNKINMANEPVLYLNTIPEGIGNSDQYLRNIYINYPKEAQFLWSATTCFIKMRASANTWYSSNSYNSNGYYYSQDVPTSGWNDESNDTDSDNNHYVSSQYGYNYARAYLGDNIIVKVPLNTSYCLDLQHVGIKSDLIEGMVNVHCSILDLNKLKHHLSDRSGIRVRGNSFVKINEYEIDKDYAGYNGNIQTDFVNGQWNSIYINKTNGIIFNEKTMYTTSSGNYTSEYYGNFNSAFVCPNYIQNGQFFARNLYTFAQSWNVRREGSSVTSGTLRFRNNASESAWIPLEIGLNPANGILISPGSIGKKKAICYLACKNFDPTLLFNGSKNCGIKVETMEHITDAYDSEKTYDIKHEYTSWGMCWLEDDSVWLNDINLKKYRIELPIEVFNLDTQVDVKLWYNWYSVNGVTYMDPGIRLVDYE